MLNSTSIREVRPSFGRVQLQVTCSQSGGGFPGIIAPATVSGRARGRKRSHGRRGTVGDMAAPRPVAGGGRTGRRHGALETLRVDGSQIRGSETLQRRGTGREEVGEGRGAQGQWAFLAACGRRSSSSSRVRLALGLLSSLRGDRRGTPARPEVKGEIQLPAREGPAITNLHPQILSLFTTILAP